MLLLYWLQLLILKLKSISLENKGAALKLTSAQFKNLLSSESSELKYSGTIVIDGAVTGTAAEVLSQITDFRVKLNPGYSISAVTGSVTADNTSDVSGIKR